MASNPISEETSNPSIQSTAQKSSRTKSDPAWQYCTETIANGHSEIKCMYYNKFFIGGGVRRFKYHLSCLFGCGCNPCICVNNEVKHTMKLNIESGEVLKKNTATKKSRGRAFQNEDDDMPLGLKKRFTSTSVQPTDSNKSPTLIPRITTSSQSTIKNVLQGQAIKDNVDIAIAKWFYDASIPFNAMNSVSYQIMINVIISFGKGYEGPNLYALPDKLLKNCVKQANNEVKTSRFIKINRLYADGGWMVRSKR